MFHGHHDPRKRRCKIPTERPGLVDGATSPSQHLVYVHRQTLVLRGLPPRFKDEAWLRRDPSAFDPAAISMKIKHLDPEYLTVGLSGAPEQKYEDVVETPTVVLSFVGKNIVLKFLDLSLHFYDVINVQMRTGEHEGKTFPCKPYSTCGCYTPHGIRHEVAIPLETMPKSLEFDFLITFTRDRFTESIDSLVECPLKKEEKISEKKPGKLALGTTGDEVLDGLSLPSRMMLNYYLHAGRLDQYKLSRSEVEELKKAARDKGLPKLESLLDKMTEGKAMDMKKFLGRLRHVEFDGKHPSTLIGRYVTLKWGTEEVLLPQPLYRHLSKSKFSSLQRVYDMSNVCTKDSFGELVNFIFGGSVGNFSFPVEDLVQAAEALGADDLARAVVNEVCPTFPKKLSREHARVLASSDIETWNQIFYTYDEGEQPSPDGLTTVNVIHFEYDYAALFDGWLPSLFSQARSSEADLLFGDVRLHRFVACARSDVLEKILLMSATGNVQELKLEDTPHLRQLFVEFLYTGRMDSSLDITHSEAALLALVQAEDYYNTKGLAAAFRKRMLEIRDLAKARGEIRETNEDSDFSISSPSPEESDDGSGSCMSEDGETGQVEAVLPVGEDGPRPKIPRLASPEESYGGSVSCTSEDGETGQVEAVLPEGEDGPRPKRPRLAF